MKKLIAIIAILFCFLLPAWAQEPDSRYVEVTLGRDFIAWAGFQAGPNVDEVKVVLLKTTAKHLRKQKRLTAVEWNELVGELVRNLGIIPPTPRRVKPSCVPPDFAGGRLPSQCFEPDR